MLKKRLRWHYTSTDDDFSLQILKATEWEFWLFQFKGCIRWELVYEIHSETVIKTLSIKVALISLSLNTEVYLGQSIQEWTK